MKYMYICAMYYISIYMFKQMRLIYLNKIHAPVYLYVYILICICMCVCIHTHTQKGSLQVK